MNDNHTLILNPSDSRCGNCGLGADPHETHHNTVLAYSPNVQPPGCGQRFVLMRSNYMGVSVAAAAIRMRPDLEWVGFDR